MKTNNNYYSFYFVLHEYVCLCAHMSRAVHQSKHTYAPNKEQEILFFFPFFARFIVTVEAHALLEERGSTRQVIIPIKDTIHEGKSEREKRGEGRGESTIPQCSERRQYYKVCTTKQEPSSLSTIQWYNV